MCIRDRFIKYWGNGSWRNASEKSKIHETQLLYLNIEKVKKELGWMPLLSVDEAVKLTIQWYRSYKSHKNMYNFCKKQILDYMKKMPKFDENN